MTTPRKQPLHYNSFESLERHFSTLPSAVAAAVALGFVRVEYRFKTPAGRVNAILRGMELGKRYWLDRLHEHGPVLEFPEVLQVGRTQALYFLNREELLVGAEEQEALGECIANAFVAGYLAADDRYGEVRTHTKAAAQGHQSAL